MPGPVRSSPEHLLAGWGEGDGGGGGMHGRLADQHRSGGSSGLEPRGRVDQVARDHALSLGSDGDGRLTGHQTGAGGDAVAQLGDDREQVQGSPDRALGIVLTRDGRAPYRHHRIADELLDGAAIALHHVTGDLEVPPEQVADLLRVATLGEGGEADQVCEQDGDQP